MAPPCDAAPTTVVATPGQRKVEFVCFDDGVFTVKGRMDLAARPALLYELLTDYECAPRVFGNVKSVQVHERVPGEAMRVTQTCKWAFTVFSGTFDCEFAVTEDEASRGLRFTQLSSSFMKSFEGRWHVEPAVLAGSSSSSSGAAATAAPSADAACRVEYVMSVRPNVDVPPQISEYVNGIFTQQVSCIFDDLEAEVKARVAARS
ncbi:hypothetical protein FOA52_000709 [Chlamydomonas sp. UWO 241]|nr:hypothetical protein FOA52_000709 [Chlamydomonas sp. UWO 241]